MIATLIPIIFQAVHNAPLFWVFPHISEIFFLKCANTPQTSRVLPTCLSIMQTMKIGKSTQWVQGIIWVKANITDGL